MDYTTSNANVTHSGTGHRMHQDSAPVPTEVSAVDLNQVIWSLMKLLADAGISAATFDPDTPATYDRVSLAVQALGGLQVADFQGSNQTLSGSGFQKLPGGLILQWTSVSFTSPLGGEPGTTGTTTLPTTFPTACLHAFLTISITAGNPSNFGPAVTAVSASSVTWGVQEWADAVNPGVLHILAIGH